MSIPALDTTLAARLVEKAVSLDSVPTIEIRFIPGLNSNIPAVGLPDKTVKSVNNFEQNTNIPITILLTFYLDIITRLIL